MIMFSAKKKQYYFDHASATPMDGEVFSRMQKILKTDFYNPSALYAKGQEVHSTIERARSSIADNLKARPGDIYFFDGATEANNLVIQGMIALWRLENPNKLAHVITSEIEHASVIGLIQGLEKKGLISASYLSVNSEGLIQSGDLKKTLKEYPDTAVLSIAYANGEIGSIQDLRSIMKTVRHHRKHQSTEYPLVHSDAVQAVNYCDEIGVLQLGIDAMVINAAKIYGPKKIAAAWIRQNATPIAMLYGGNQEKGIRPGTENASSIVGIATALGKTREIQTKELSRLRELQEYVTSEIQGLFPVAIINNALGGNSLPHILNITFPGLSHEEILIRLDARGIMCSMKSACKSGEEGDSHVIRALRDKETESLRFSFGRDTKKNDINYLLDQLQDIISGMKKTKEHYLL